MPSKRPSHPSEDPPSASSSYEDDEEEIEASQEEEQQQPTPKSRSKKPDSSSDEEEGDTDESESESDSGIQTQNHNTSPALDIKPISSKPMTDLPKPKKPTTSTESPVPASASAKRKSKSEIEEKDSRKDKKKKKVSDLVVEENETEKRSGDDQKKLLFQRLWTEEDEIVILKGMISFKRKGKDPTSQVGQLLDSIKDSLQTPDVNKGQLQTKLRTLKKKYQNAAKKAKPGEDPNITKDHEKKVYQLAKKVWGEDAGKEIEEETDVKSAAVDSALVDGKKSKSRSSVAAAVVSPPPKVAVAAVPNGSPVVAAKVENKAKVEDDSETSDEYIYLSGSLQHKNPLMMPILPPGLGEIVSKGGWDVIGSEQAKDLDQRWKKVMIAETKAYLQRIDLVKEQTLMMLDVLESSKP